MSGRDLSAESIANLLLRAVRAFKGRLIGSCYSMFGIFGWFSLRGLYFANLPRVMNSKVIRLDTHVHLGLNARIECYPNYSKKNDHLELIHIGEFSSFGDYLHIGATNRVSIGKFVLGGSNILIIDHNHGRPSKDMRDKNSIPPRLREVTSYSEVHIGDNVWIGDNCVLLQGTVLEEGVIVPTGSVVNSRVPAYTIFKKNG